MLARNPTRWWSALSLVLGVAAPALLALGACADQPTAPSGRGVLVPALSRSAPTPTVTVTNIVDLGTLGLCCSAAYDVNERLSLRLNCNNLLDQRYIDRVGGGHFIPGAGRSASLTTCLEF